MVKALFLDIDGTLVLGEPHQRYIPEYNLVAMRQLLKHGVMLITASGRPHQFTRDEINKLHGFSCDAIGQNGAIIYCKDRVITTHYCPKEKLLAVALLLKDQEGIEGMAVSYEDFAYFDAIDPETKERVDAITDFNGSRELTNITCLDVLSAAEFGDPLRMMVYCPGWEITNSWVQRLNEEFLEDLEICATAGHTFEIVAKGINKGKAVSELCAYYDWDFDEIAAIGDSDNDISMLSLTKHCYKMAESSEKVKALPGKTVTIMAEAAADIISYNTQGNNQ